MKSSAFFITFLATFAVSATLTFAQEPIAELKHRPFKESFQKEAPVSGRVVAGVLLTGSAAIDALSLIPPHSAAGSSICIQVMSRDGRYWSENTFELPGDFGAKPVRLEYPSRHQDFLQHLDFGDLAILASAGECGASETPSLYLAGAKSVEQDAPSASVLINSGRAQTYISVKNIPSLKRPVPCKQIEQGRRTGFDTICQIEVEGLDPLPESLEVRILRRRYERMLPPAEFTLLLPHRN